MENMKLRKTLKVAAVTIVSAAVLVLAVIAVAIHFVFTPEKLTPVVLDVANRSLDARLDMKRVELTFFSTFPRFGLELTDGSLVSKAVRDTLWQHTDSLLSFRKCVVVVNPLDYLRKQKINLRYLGIEGASVYAFKSADGRANWDIALADTAAVQADTAASASPSIGEIEINRVSLKHANVVFDDRDTRVYASLKNADLDLRARLRKGHSVLSLNFKNENILFWQDGQLLLNHIAAEANADIALDRKSHTLALEDTRLAVNGVALDLHGTLMRDTLEHAALVDLKYGLHAPSLETVLRMVPESVLKRESVSVAGKVELGGTVKGKYGKKNMPEVTLHMGITDASAKYDKLPYGVDHFTAELDAYVDLMRNNLSFADLKILRFQGAHTDIYAEGKVSDLLGDPNISFKTRSEVDLTALAQTFPLQEGVSMGGKLDADIGVRCRLSSLKKQDLGRILLGGRLELEKVFLRDAKKNFDFTGDASLAFVGDNSLSARAEISSMLLRASGLYADMKQLKATVRSTNPQDSTRIVDMECKLEMNRLKGAMGDSLNVFSKHTQATVRLQPGKKNPSMPRINLSLETDTLFCRMGNMRMGMDKGGFAVDAEKVRDSVWNPHGIIGFNRLKLNVPQFALPVYMRKTAVTVGNRRIALKNASVRIGHSDLTASGEVHRLYEVLKKGGMLKANLDISSYNLDCNQLISALNFPEDTLLEVSEEKEDTAAALRLFVIPKNVDFELQTSLKKVTYGKMKFENVRGAVDIRNQAVHLKHLSMRGLDADLNTTVVYHASRKEHGYAGFDFRLRKVNIGKLVDFVPSLDSIVPMLRSFKGMVDFDAAAEAVLDSNLNIKIPSLRAAVHIRGDSLVLMDGETFAEISKKLMFKNKKRNVFDSISVNLTVKDGNVTVYPFVVQIDRYKAAVGGTQGLDMNFQYHISILKSPLPFKAGVNISGNLDKMKIRIGRAKYKDAVTPVAIRKVDSTRVNMGQAIVRDFERVMERGARRRIPKLAE